MSIVQPDPQRSLIELRPVTSTDIDAIKGWPPYTDGFEQMDYALREQGWLDEFRERSSVQIFAALSDGRLAGFSLLALQPDGSAEFRIALHPERIGKGLGRAVAVATLHEGFDHLRLGSVHLIVRKNNVRALKLYRSIGFAVTGESVRAIQGRATAFIDMRVSREAFLKGRNTHAAGTVVD